MTGRPRDDPARLAGRRAAAAIPTPIGGQGSADSPTACHRCRRRDGQARARASAPWPRPPLRAVLVPDVSTAVRKLARLEATTWFAARPATVPAEVVAKSTPNPAFGTPDAQVCHRHLGTGSVTRKSWQKFQASDREVGRRWRRTGEGVSERSVGGGAERRRRAPHPAPRQRCTARPAQRFWR